MRVEDKVEKQALRDIVDGFNKQGIAIPTIAMRYLELEGEFTKEQVTEAEDLYKDILLTKLKGHNLTVCQVAAYHIIAELVLQVKESLIKQDLKKPVERNPSYG